jgi:hypothetical protein
VTVGIDDPADPPSALFAHRGCFRSPSIDCSSAYGIWIVDDQQRPAGPAADVVRTESAHLGTGRGNPEASVTDRQLSNDVVAVTNSMKRSRTEGHLVEGHSVLSPINPQLRLDVRHTAILADVERVPSSRRFETVAARTSRTAFNGIMGHARDHKLTTTVRKSPGRRRV